MLAKYRLVRIVDMWVVSGQLALQAVFRDSVLIRVVFRLLACFDPA